MRASLGPTAFCQRSAELDDLRAATSLRPSLAALLSCRCAQLRGLALPEWALVGPARGSRWWQRAGHEVTVDVVGDAPALAKGDVPPSVEGQQPAARQLPGDGHGVLVRRGGVEPGADDEDRRRSAAGERPGVTIPVTRRPGGAGLREIRPK